MFGKCIAMLYVASISAFIAVTQAASPQSCLIQRNQFFASIQESRALVGETDPEHTSINTADLAATLKEMMEKIDASTTKGHNATSPEVVTAVNDMMAEFQSMAEAKFKKAFGATQDAIKAAVEELKASTAHLDTQKQAADNANINLGTCRKAEKSKLQIQENCRTQGEWFNKTSDDACKEMQDAQYHEWDVDEELVKMQHCDLSQEDCTDLDSLKQHIDEHFRIAESKRATYKKKIESCETARKTSVDNEATCITKSTDFLTKKDECDFDDYSTSVKMCDFGAALQAKCDKHSKLMDLVKATQGGRGSKHSEVDRMEQWKKAMTLKCVLKSYTGHGATNEGVKAACESAVNYKRDVGVMDYMTNEIASQMRPAPPMFTCQEKSVRFSGQNVTVGEASEEYKFEALFEPNVTLSPMGSAAFSFCLPNATKADCRGFSCPVDKPAKPSPEAQKCHLTKCTVYECCTGAGPAAPAKAA